MKIGVSVRYLGESIFARTAILVPFGRKVDMEIVKSFVFDPIRVFMALAVVSSKPEELIGIRWVDREYYREVHCVEIALSKDKAKEGSILADNVQFALFVSSFVAK